MTPDHRFARVTLVPPPAPLSMPDSRGLSTRQRRLFALGLLLSILSMLLGCSPEPLPAEARVYVERRIVIEFPGEAFRDRAKKQKWVCSEVKP